MTCHNKKKKNSNCALIQPRSESGWACFQSLQPHIQGTSEASKAGGYITPKSPTSNRPQSRIYPFLQLLGRRHHECKWDPSYLSILYYLLLTKSSSQIVEWAFGKRMTPAERLRKHQRSLEKTQRELDRERVKLENQEKKLIQEIKKSAKNGQMGACKIQAKDLVRTRRYIEKFYSMRTQLQAISLRIQVSFWLTTS